MAKIKIIGLIVLTGSLSLIGADAAEAAATKNQLSFGLSKFTPTKLEQAVPKPKEHGPFGYDLNAAARDFACFAADVITEHAKTDDFIKFSLAQKEGYDQALVDHVYAQFLQKKYPRILSKNLREFGGMGEFLDFLNKHKIAHPYQRAASK